MKIEKVGENLPDLVFNNQVIKRIESTKYLRIGIHESLSLKEQYKAVKSKLKNGISSLRMLKTLLLNENMEYLAQLQEIVC